MQNSEIIQRLVEQAKQLNLTRLDLSDYRLDTFPNEILSLKQLEILDLHDNQITEIPESIDQLSQLKRLDLAHNYIKSLPENLSQLTQLQILNLGHNALSDPIDILVNLTHLQVLNLRNNNLQNIPKQLVKLTLLQELYLGHNQITQFPKNLHQLKVLRSLDLAHNKLLKLPIEIIKFNQHKLKHLYLQNNPLPIPPEILNKFNYPSEIIHYYLQVTAQIEENKPLNEAKVLLVGEGEVGKTSVAKRLLYQNYDAHENKTDGIHIDHWYVPLNEQELRLNVWDFGGQEIMHATHQFFLTKRSIYLLILDARRDESGNRIEYWLKLIQSFSEGSPIIVVINKTDQQALSLNRTGLQVKYPSILGYYDISCQNNTGLMTLKEAIINAVCILPHVFDPFPNDWLKIKHELENLDIDFLPYQSYIDICQQYQVNDPISQRTLISFLHDLGIALNFYDDPRLQDTNILNPEWLTNGVYTLLNSLMLFKNKGVFNNKDLTKILGNKRYPTSKHDFLIQLMRKFELCFPFSQGESYLIPDLLPKEEPDLGWEQHINNDFLAFEYHYDVLPNSVFSRVLVRLYTLVSKRTYWRTGVVLAYENNKALIKADMEDNFISIKIMGNANTRRVLLGMIRQNFEHVHSTIQQIKVEEKVPYHGVLISYRHLLTLEQAQEKYFIPEGLQKKISVRQLLEGIEDQYLHHPAATKIAEPNTKTKAELLTKMKANLLGFNNLLKAGGMSALTLSILAITQQLIMPLPPVLIQSVIMLLVIALLGLVVSYRSFIITLMGGIIAIVIVSSFAALKGGIGEKTLLELVSGSLKQVGLLTGNKVEIEKAKPTKAPNKNKLEVMLKDLILSNLKISMTNLGVKLSLSDVLFDSGKVRLRIQAFPDLKKIAHLLIQYPSYQLIIAGHTDNIGNKNHNMRLSQQRAEAIHEILHIQGIAYSRMQIHGYGDTQPVANNKTAEGRQKNRRVEIIIKTVTKESKP